MGWVRQLKPDGFLIAIVVAAVVASFLPATGSAQTALSWAITVAIFALFFLYGARLKPSEALVGLTHWRLHLTILAFTYLVFPVVGLALGVLSPRLLSAELYTGLLYLMTVPATVQSAVAFTSIARGNVAGAIVSSSTSNLLGVVLTPTLVMVLLATSGRVRVGASAIVDIALQLLLPFCLGQLSRRWTADVVATYKAPLRLVDQASIVMVVYLAFSRGVEEQMWSRTTPFQLVVLVVVCLLVVLLMLTLTWFTARRLGFNREDAIAIQFCGTKKSMATGLPMAQVLFAGMPIGLLVLPLMVFHQIQLMACSVLAGRYARQGEAASQPSSGLP